MNLEEIHFEKIWAVINRSQDEEILLSSNTQDYIETLMNEYHLKKVESSSCVIHSQPQAGFYYWIQRKGTSTWEPARAFQYPHKIVFDVGGSVIDADQIGRRREAPIPKWNEAYYNRSDKWIVTPKEYLLHLVENDSTFNGTENLTDSGWRNLMQGYYDYNAALKKSSGISNAFMSSRSREIAEKIFYSPATNGKAKKSIQKGVEMINELVDDKVREAALWVDMKSNPPPKIDYHGGQTHINKNDQRIDVISRDKQR